ncbi:RC-LH1 core complex protein PufX [Rhodobacter sp. Har01]|uniref:RC-LH1 core complex protein PufX n=1 Tax=Rhodobacter sp. Har01 TaxID=2883999 RepID=UPI001D073226|nr:RC-LH1 core complex protein PufX [Rhodobacter sp. Har01]MCB6176878.1 RC-LH1 core complex protein PufX [Rhodobacter sp. Har01]
MAEYNYSHDPKSVTHLRSWVLGQMSRGAFVAMFWVILVACWLGVTWVIGALLPPESKLAPSPYGALEVVQTIDVA